MRNGSKFNRCPSRQRHIGYIEAAGLGWLGGALRDMSSGKGRDNVERACVRIDLTPMSDIDLMIANGWGDTPQNRLPPDWRERRRGGKV